MMMKEETRIELLKIAATLAVPAIERYPNAGTPSKAGVNGIAYIEVFNSCVKAVQEQYQALAEIAGK
jgi:hypothetical protein